MWGAEPAGQRGQRIRVPGRERRGALGPLFCVFTGDPAVTTKDVTEAPVPREQRGRVTTLLASSCSVPKERAGPPLSTVCQGCSSQPVLPSPNVHVTAERPVSLQPGRPPPHSEPPAAADVSETPREGSSELLHAPGSSSCGLRPRDWRVSSASLILRVAHLSCFAGQEPCI